MHIQTIRPFSNYNPQAESPRFGAVGANGGIRFSRGNRSLEDDDGGVGCGYGCSTGAPFNKEMEARKAQEERKTEDRRDMISLLTTYQREQVARDAYYASPEFNTKQAVEERRSPTQNQIRGDVSFWLVAAAIAAGSIAAVGTLASMGHPHVKESPSKSSTMKTR